MELQRLSGNRGVSNLLATQNVQRGKSGVDDIKKGSAAKNKALGTFLKNEKWEIGFRKLTNLKGGFNPMIENDRLTELKKKDVEEAIKTNESFASGGYPAVSRNPDFVLNVLGAGMRNYVVVLAIPPNFGIDLEAMYLKYVEQTEGGLPREYKENITSKLSREITLQRLPAGCVYGWVERIFDAETKTATLTWHANDIGSVRPAITKIDDEGRYADFIAKVRKIENVTLDPNFPA